MPVPVAIRDPDDAVILGEALAQLRRSARHRATRISWKRARFRESESWSPGASGSSSAVHAPRPERDTKDSELRPRALALRCWRDPAQAVEEDRGSGRPCPRLTTGGSAASFNDGEALAVGMRVESAGTWPVAGRVRATTSAALGPERVASAT